MPIEDKVNDLDSKEVIDAKVKDIVALGISSIDQSVGLVLSIITTGAPLPFFGLKLFTNTLGYFYYSNHEKQYQAQQQLIENTTLQLPEK